MKTMTCLGALALGLAVAGAATAGVWEDEIPITQDPITQYRSYIATGPDDAIYVLWPDWTVWEDTKVMLQKSTDYGQTWTAPSILFQNKPYDNFAILADDAGVHVLIVEFFENPQHEYKWLFYSKSTDGGQTFSSPVQIGNRENIELVKMYSKGDTLYVFAMNYADPVEVAYLYLSTDGGETWIERQLLSGYIVHHPELLPRDDGLHVVFGGMLVTPGIKYAVSTDDGMTWSTPVDVSASAGPHSQLPQIAIDDNAIHVAWEDDRTDHFNVMYSRSTDGGVTWSADEQINDTYYGARSRLLADEEGLHIVWCQYHGVSGWPSSWSSADYGIIWYKFSDDSGLSWTDEFRVSQNEGIDPINLPGQGANYVKLAEYGSGFCAMWQDKRDGNIDLYLRNSFPGPACPADVNGDSVVDVLDLLAVLSAWGATSGPEDINGDGVVDVLDLLELLAAWGPC